MRKTTFDIRLCFILCFLLFNKSWAQNTDLVVYPTLVFYHGNTPADDPEVDDLIVKIPDPTSSEAANVVWYDRPVGGTQYSPSDKLDENNFYFAELPGSTINSRLQTKVYYADTPVISEGNITVCNSSQFTLTAENLLSVDDFEPILTAQGFTRLQTGLTNGNYHFIRKNAILWSETNELINGTPGITTTAGIPGVSIYMLSDGDIGINRQENRAVWAAISDDETNLDISYWLGLKQFTNANDYIGIGTVAGSRAAWYWIDGTYYDENNPIHEAEDLPDGSFGDWFSTGGIQREPNDWDGSNINAREQDLAQLNVNRQSQWRDQIETAGDIARSGVVVEFTESQGIQWQVESTTTAGQWDDIPGETNSTLTINANFNDASRNYRVIGTFNGSTKSSNPVTVTSQGLNIGNGITNPTGETETELCKVGETLQLDADTGVLPATASIMWNALPNGSVIFDDATAGSVTITSLAAGANTDVSITYTVTDGGCTGTANEYIVKIGPDLSAPNFGTPSELLFCNGTMGDELPSTDNNSLNVVWFDPNQTGYDPTMPENATPVANSDVLIANRTYHVFSTNATSSTNITCYSDTHTEVTIQLTSTVNTAPLTTLSSCSTGNNNGTLTAEFTLNNTTTLNEIFGTENPNDYTLEYYTDVSDPSTIIPNNNWSSYTSPSQTLDVLAYDNRVQNTDRCLTFQSTLELVVNSSPIISITNTEFGYCGNGSVTISITEQGNYTYEWYFNGSTTPIPGETGNTITVMQPGVYNVIAETNLGCRTSLPEDINVRQSEAPTLAGNYTVSINNGNGQVTIDEANLGSGDYEYAIDNGSYQDSPIITGIEPGEHTLIANDKFGCGSDSVMISIFGFPKFFSPNNDGINDVWNVKGLDTSIYNHSEVTVFDRFGKLITRFNTSDTGWDGFYNGTELPATDYWFETEISDVNGNTNKIQGHFSLIR